jgi:hypothetical protein
MQSEDGVMIVEDSIAENPYTDENEIICWHYDHAKDRSVKGIGFVSAMYHANGLSLPVGFRLIAKTETYIDKKDGKQKRRSTQTKNEHYRDLLRQAVRNRIPFKFVLNDVWYAAADNMKYIKHDLKKDFIMPIKSNRKVALSLDDNQQGRFVTVDTLPLEPPPPWKSTWKVSTSRSCWSSRSSQTKMAASVSCIWCPAIPPSPTTT